MVPKRARAAERSAAVTPSGRPRTCTTRDGPEGFTSVEVRRRFSSRPTWAPPSPPSSIGPRLDPGLGPGAAIRWDGKERAQEREVKRDRSRERSGVLEREVQESQRAEEGTLELKIQKKFAARPAKDFKTMAQSAKPVLMYSHPSMTHLAERIRVCCEEQPHDGCRKIEVRNSISWGRFEDAFPNLFIEGVKEMAGTDVLFLASFHDAAAIFEQLAVLYALPRYLARSLTVILPYFPCATMERVDFEGQVATAATMSRMLSNIPVTCSGPTRIVIYDIHALQERFYFSDSVLPRLETAVPLLLKRLRQFPADIQDKMAIAFPDEGAFKRFSRMFSDFPTIVCHKIRREHQRIVTVKEGDATGKFVIIVDDLVKTGGTLLNCAKVLREVGAEDVSAFVTHAVFPQESWKRFLGSDVFQHFWHTDSCPTSINEFEGRPPFEMLSLAPEVAQTLLGYDLQ
eukprot:m.76960 g.76960  ORF g.76960 m.76960 type:complete len:457 (-) comp14531_c0_seq2:56-1426(-)